jgi:hypothetical protein
VNISRGNTGHSQICENYDSGLGTVIIDWNEVLGCMLFFALQQKL